VGPEKAVKILELSAEVPCIFSPLLYRLSYLGLECGSAYLNGSGRESQAPVRLLGRFRELVLIIPGSAQVDLEKCDVKSGDWK